MWSLRSLEHAGVIQKLTILEHKNGLELSNTRVPVSGTWSILFSACTYRPSPFTFIEAVKSVQKFLHPPWEMRINGIRWHSQTRMNRWEPKTRRFSNHVSHLLSWSHTFAIIVILDLKIHQSMWIHWPFFPKTWTKGHWPLDDLWPHVCWGHMCDSTQGSLCPSPMTIHQCMWIQWSILQNTTYIHTHTYLHTYYILRTEWVIT